ncbi:MAG: hypothetical protein WAX44_00895 [Minisyncoccia bacterium]
MLNLIERLREKPHKIRKKIALLIAVTFSGIILLMWAIVIYPSFREQEKRDIEAINSEPSPLSAFSDLVYSSLLTFGGEVANFKNSLGGLSGSETYVQNNSENIPKNTSSTSDLLIENNPSSD